MWVGYSLWKLYIHPPPVIIGLSQHSHQQLSDAELRSLSSLEVALLKKWPNDHAGHPFNSAASAEVSLLKHWVA